MNVTTSPATTLPPEIEALAREHHNGNMREEELRALATALLSIQWKPGQLICELGTFHGYTAAFLARVAEGADLPCTVLSVDSFESPYLKDLPERSVPYYTTLAKYGVSAGRNALMPLRTMTAAPFVPDTIGLLLVDADHEYAACLADLRAYAPKVVPGGVIAVDDVWYDSVRQACADFPWLAHGFIQETALEKIAIYRRQS